MSKDPSIAGQTDQPTVDTVKMSEMPRRRSEGYASVYANSANVMSTFWDFRIVFSELVFHPGSGNNNIVLEDKVSVAMSWEHAAAFSELLTLKLKQYEERNNTKIRPKPQMADVEL